MELKFYLDLRKYVQDRLEEVIDDDTNNNTTNMRPLKVSLINISIFCSNEIIKMGGK